MYEVVEELVLEVVQRVLMPAEPEVIVLCGWRARAIAKPGSDLDLSMINRDADKRDLRRLYHGLVSGIHVPKSILKSSPRQRQVDLPLSPSAAPWP